MTFLFSIVAGCTGGSDSPAAEDAGGGTSSSSGGSGSSGGTDGTPCTELHVGGTNDPRIGGSVTSQVAAQAAADFAGVSTPQLSDLTTSCKNIATALGAPSGDQATADAKTVAREKADAWCRLATNALRTSKAKSGGSTSVQFPRQACKTSVAMKAACQGRCAGAPCDTTANPMTCTGGNLANGFCEGGKLEGGCTVDARCDVSCDAAVIARADCPAPLVTVSTVAAADPTEAAKLKTSLEADLPMVLALDNKCQLEANIAANIAASFSGTVASVTDIKKACIPLLVVTAQNAVSDVQVCASSTARILADAQ